jgi:polysaccharide deacetylase family protein (PEP-CTERM system associated)
MVNALSIDLEDHYHVCGLDSNSAQESVVRPNGRLQKSVNNIINLLERDDIHATFFVVGELAKSYPELIKKIVDRGHEVASHGFVHKRIFDMSQEEFEQDLIQSKVAIENASGKEVVGYRAPEWSLKRDNIWVFDILKKHGFRYDASAVPLSHLGGSYFDLYPYEITTKYGNIFEFPLSTFRCFWERIPFSGGLPMRITPYFYVLDCARAINRSGYPIMFYLHAWEFDNEPEKIDLPINRKFMHYCNLKSTSKKTRFLLERMQFSTVENVLGIKEPTCNNRYIRKETKNYYDSTYFISMLKAYIFIGSLATFIFAVSFLMKQYAFLLILVLATVFYWPWGLLLKKINSLFK